MMGRIADHVSTMRGCSLAQIVQTIAEMEEQTLSVGADEFQRAWDQWPSKTAKKAAEKAYRAARKRGISAKTIVNGMMAYVATKPPDRPWLHLATFINGERWNDQPAAVGPKPSNTSELRNDLRNRIASQGSADLGSVRRLPQRQALG